MNDVQLSTLRRRRDLQALSASLLGAIGFSALLIGSAAADPVSYEGLCELEGSTVTCAGDEAALGVNVGDIGVTLLDIENINSNIVPASGTPGVVLDTSSPATADIDLGNYTINATGEGADGIYVSAWGDGTDAALTLIGNVESEQARGVVVTGSGAVTSDTTGNISALGDALTAKSWGGATEVDHVGNLTSLEGRGLSVEGLGNTITVDGDIDSLGDGIYSHGWGDGESTVNVTGNVTSHEGRGVVVEEDSSSAEVTISGNINALGDALDVSSISDATVSVTGTITSHQGRGVVLVAAEGNADLTLSGATTAKSDAIYATVGGADDFGIDIQSNGAITSYEGRGIFADAKTSGGMSADSQTFGVRIDQTGDVTAKLDALTATTVSSNVYVDVEGDVVSYIGKGIYASSLDKLVDVDVTGKIESKLDAVTIAARTSSTLDAGNVTSFDGSAISATVIEGGMTVDVGNVTGKVDGIYVNAGNGTASVTADNVIAYDGKGVHVEAAKSDATLTVGDVTSQLDAIYTYSGNGSVSVTARDVTSYSGKGITAQTAEGSVTVKADDLISQLDAIHAEAGNGSVNVTAADITSYNGKGVIALSEKSSVTLTLDAVTSQGDAIYAGAGNGSVKVTALDVFSEDGLGIFAQSLTSTATVAAGNVESQGDAIYAEANNGAATVTAGSVTSEDGRGVFASALKGSASVDVGNVDSHLDAIYAEGGASVTVDASDVVSALGRGVFATTSNGLVDIAVGSVTGDLDAIYAQSTGASGDGSVTVAATGNVLSHNGRGIYAYAVNGPLDIDALDVTSKADGITASGLNGAIDIATTGAIWSYEGRGIVAATQTGTIDVSAAGITSKLDAITASTPDGAITVAVGGNVTSDEGKGIDVGTLSGAIDVDAGSVTAKLVAINAVTSYGAVDIDVVNAITSWDGSGVIASTNSGSVMVSAGSVTSKLVAIDASTKDGNVAVDVGGSVEAYDGFGIKAATDTGGVVIDVAGDVTSKLGAITASTNGAGQSATIDVDIAGNIVSHSGYGILAEAANGSVTIDNGGALTARLGGIEASTTGAGPDAFIDISQTGKLTSWTGIGIDAYSAGGPVVVTATGGIEADLDAIRAASDGGDDVGTVTITTGGTITSHKGSGIVAAAVREGVTIDNTGDIFADVDGISATGTGNTETSDIDIDQHGNITVAKGRGIHAEGLVDVAIALDGDITGGTHSIHATSLAGAVDVAIAEGSVISGSSVAGVSVSSETGATLTNRGDISSAWGYALEFAGVGAGTVDNYGSITGDFVFNDTAGAFNNLAGGTFNAGTLLNLGGGTLTNAGLIDFSTGGGDSALVDSVLTGNLVQTATGQLNSDIRFSDNASDRLVVSGTATLGGTVSVRAHDIDAGLLKDFMLVTATEGLTLDGVTLSNPVLKGTVVAENGTDAILRIEGVDFAPGPLGEQFEPVSAYIGDVFTAGPPEELKPLMAELLSTADIESYEDALDQLSPEQYAQEMLNTSGYNLNFSNRLLSCRVADGENRFKAEGDCDWFGTRFSVLEQDETDSVSAFDQTFATLEAGAQRRIDDTWRLGGAVGLTSANTSSADGSSVDALQGQAGVVLKYDADDFLLASALTGGYGVHANERNVSIGGIDETLVGDAPIAYLSARLHGAYTFDMGAAYIKPLFNLDLTATHFGGVTETGGATALTIDAGTQYVATLSPAIEFGGEISDSDGTLIRPFVQLGVEASISSDLDLAARFSGVDPSIGSFTIHQADPEPQAKLSLGADVLTTDNATIRLYYDGSISASSRKNGVGLKMSGTIQ